MTSVVKNMHLIVSLVIVVPAALIYGLSPNDSLPMLFDFSLDTIDQKNVFRAIMGLYLAVSTVWLLGIIKTSLWRTATVLNIVFMLGLAIGRLLSVILDGIPSPAFLWGMWGEFILGSYAFWQLHCQKQ